MRKENNQNVIIGILATLVLVVAILVILTMNGTIRYGKNDNEVIDNEIIEKESNQRYLYFAGNCSSDTYSYASQRRWNG